VLQEVVLPRLGQTVEEASIDAWRVNEGDAVKKGDILLEITTDKATLEVESYVQGTVLKIYADAGSTVPVNAVIAYVGDPDKDEAPAEPPTPVAAEEPAASAPASAGAPAGTATAAGTSAAPATASSAAVAAPSPPAAPQRPGRLFISPRAKRRAGIEKVTPLAVRGSGPNGRIVEDDVLAYVEKVNELRVTSTAREIAARRGVDLLTVKGTGTGGRIMKADVESAPALAPAGTGRTLEWTPARRIIAQRMSQSKAQAPHFYLQVEIDMTDAFAWRSEMKAAGTKVSFNDLIMKAIAVGFGEVPVMNASWAGEDIALHASVDVALAVSIDDGLVTPVVRGIDRLDLEGIAEQSAALIEKARGKRLAPFEYEGGTITVSNLGMYGVVNFIPIINPGQASILGVGEIADKVVAIDGGIGVRKMMGVTLSIDHRVANGADAAAFLQVVKAALESPRTSLG
jgi:pyruvate dehydrogenase E2 component (dihydrolipoamide acetyltransferase)